MRPLCQLVRHYSNAELQCINISRSSFRVPQHLHKSTNVFFTSANHSITPQRFFSIKFQLRDKPQIPGEQVKYKASQPSQSQITDPPVHHAPEEDLPSHREAQRWDISKRAHALMDDLMQKISVAAQRINKYTGTDYTGIEALRREIKDQEQLVRARHKAVQSAKSALDAALDQRSTSQKSVVALLERKSSWAASDLETYMSLIRSEHAHDQAVEASKDAVTAAEQALEEARARLEKRERAQYHEEQIWSDTIRRNGTWITLGLMGVNIALLVVNLVAVEPWRRKRLVGEIKGLLKDEMGTRGDINTHETLTTNESNKVSGEPMSGENVDGDNAEGENVEVSAYQSGVVLEEPTAITDNAFQPLNSEWIASYFRNPFGEQIITIRKTDLTGLVLQSAATGSILIWAIFYILRPR